jgi:hypothetical protein
MSFFMLFIERWSSGCSVEIDCRRTDGLPLLEPEDEGRLLLSPNTGGKSQSPDIGSVTGSCGETKVVPLIRGEEKELETDMDERGPSKLAVMSLGSTCCGRGCNGAKGGIGKVTTGPIAI